MSAEEPLTRVTEVPLAVLPHFAPIPLSPITLWQHGSIPSVHVFPAQIDVAKLKGALDNVLHLWPVVGGRFVRRNVGKEWQYYIEHSETPLVLIHTVTSASLSPVFTTSAVIQPSLSPFVIPVPSPTPLNSPSSPLLTLHLTTSSTSPVSVLGICWEHVLGDGAAFQAFSQALSDAYTGKDIQGPSLEGHVKLRPVSEEVRSRWEIPQLGRLYDVEDAFAAYGNAYTESELVQVVFSIAEVRLLKALSKGPTGWVSEQDGLSSYFVNLLRLVGVKVDKMVNSINYRNHIPDHPAFPKTLSTLVANVSQMHATPLPPPAASGHLSLVPIARALRDDLERMKSDPERALDWLSYSGMRVKECCDQRRMMVLVPEEGEVIINSNWRYEWNFPFGFPKGTTSFHTTTTIRNFLRVFRSNEEGGGAECSFRVAPGLAAKVLHEIEQDRGEGWMRWK